MGHKDIQNVAKQQADQIIKDAEYQAKTSVEELNRQKEAAKQACEFLGLTE